MLARLSQRAADLNRLMNDRCQLDALRAQLELVARDAADIEQVVDEPHHLAELPLHRIASLQQHSVRSPSVCLMISRRIANRGERVSQFVRERGQELVLAAVGLFRRVFRSAGNLRLAADTVGRPPQHAAQQDDLNKRSHSRSERHVIQARILA